MGATVAQVAIAWVPSRGEDIVPLVGARRRDQLEEALGALELELSPQDLERIERAIPADAAAGDRYGAPQMATSTASARSGPRAHWRPRARPCSRPAAAGRAAGSC